MLPFTWKHLLEAWKDKRPKVFWTCENLNKLLQQNARDHQLTCKPHWAGPERCSYVDFPFFDGHRKCVRVKHVPEEHQELRQVCERVQKELKIKLFYKGDSLALLGNRFVHAMLVYKRTAISQEQKEELIQRQQGKCARCRDELRKWEVHHDPPLAEGGGGLCLLCCTCHAQETERQ